MQPLIADHSAAAGSAQICNHKLHFLKEALPPVAHRELGGAIGVALASSIARSDKNDFDL
jgi:hypothetical protein